MNIARAIDLLEDIQTGEGTAFEVTPELADAAKFAIKKLEDTRMKNAMWIGSIKEAFIGIDDLGNPKCADRRYYRCSNCKYGSVVQTPHCPQCGSKMDKVN